MRVFIGEESTSFEEIRDDYMGTWKMEKEDHRKLWSVLLMESFEAKSTERVRCMNFLAELLMLWDKYKNFSKYGRECFTTVMKEDVLEAEIFDSLKCDYPKICDWIKEDIVQYLCKAHKVEFIGELKNMLETSH